MATKPKDWSHEAGYTTLSLEDGSEVWEMIKNNDKVYPFFEDNLLSRIEEIKDKFKARDDDVFIIGYMKSGTHWLWEIVNMLLKSSSKVEEAVGKNDSFIESGSAESLESLPSPRVISSHLLPEDLPDILKACKIIVPIRNPKDVAVSTYHHMSKEKNGSNLRCGWDKFIEDVWFDKTLMAYTTWSEYMLEMWSLYDNSENILPVVYEQLLQNPIEIIQDMARFLELDIPETLIKEISEATRFDNMKDKKKETEKCHESTFGGGYSMFRKGISGDWKNQFTEAQVKMFDDKMKALCENDEGLSRIMLLF